MSASLSVELRVQQSNDVRCALSRVQLDTHERPDKITLLTRVVLERIESVAVDRHVLRREHVIVRELDRFL